MRKDDGSIISDEKQILQCQTQFYKKLYSKNNSVQFDLDCLPGPKLNETQQKFVNQVLTKDELSLSLQAMQNGKTPLCDGLTVKFYKTFWAKLQQPLFDALNFAISCGRLHLSARKGVITLIPKKNRDSLSLTNWRPLTMLNVDFKIYSKALANRMKKVLPDIISEDQTGFMQGRNIATNI